MSIYLSFIARVLKVQIELLWKLQNEDEFHAFFGVIEDVTVDIQNAIDILNVIIDKMDEEKNR
jgi:RecB family exonuclease